MVYVWDRVIRLTHIILIVGVVSAYASYQLGLMAWHMWNGYILLAALAFRILWGFIGSKHARFANFLKSPRAAFNYVAAWKSQKVPLGHNPLGGYAVLGLLGVLTLQAVTGLFTTDDIMTEGPLYASISSAAGDLLTTTHKNNFYVFLLPMIALHIGAITLYWRVKKANLVKPMITGYKDA